MSTAVQSGERVLVICNDFPLPANFGGRIDVWRRLGLMKSLGIETALLSWYDEPRNGLPDPAALAQLGQVCSTAQLTPIRRSLPELLQRIRYLGRLPSHVAARWVSIDRAAVLAWARVFRPTLLMLDGLYGVAVVRWLAQELAVPWIYRAHNIEHRYMRYQVVRAADWRLRAGLTVNLLGLERVERATVRDARQVLDISQSDAAFWRQQGHAQVRWLPTLVDEAYTAALAAAAQLPPLWDALYFGNLNTPNNVEAVRWLVKEVLPHLGQRPVQIAVAGSRPNDEVRQLVAADSRLVLVADPPDMAAVVGRARVLLNPVQAGSGVNLKSVEMLFSQAALVSTPAGVQGLGETVAACFTVRAEAPDFAAAMLSAIDAAPLAPTELSARIDLQRAFESAGVGAALLVAMQAPGIGAMP